MSEIVPNGYTKIDYQKKADWQKNPTPKHCAEIEKQMTKDELKPINTGKYKITETGRC